ncbi:MAG: FG-GAP-like repeat-containing protein, partial [Planctomycetota bacterium]|nr:FG-GAP-like repeat-containing protein [Planctomycetota bacterium]
DGDLDLVILRGDGVVVLRGAGDGTFSEPVTFSGGGSQMEVADLDRDGDPDLVVSASRPAGLILKVNDGGGSFDVNVRVNLERSARSLAVADFDRDGALDVALTPGSPSVVQVLWSNRSNRAGLFSVTTDTIRLSGCAPRNCRPHSLTLGDFDGDGDLDAIGCNTHQGSFAYVVNEAGVLRNTRSQAFGGEHPQSVKAGDVDGDGDVDLVTVDNRDHSFYVHRNRGDFTFERPTRLRVGNAPINVQVADLDGDGDLDAVTVNEGGSSVTPLFNTGDGTFATRGQREIRVRGGPKAAALADLDGDGDVDIAVANASSGDVSVLLNDGSGGFPERRDYRVQGSAHHVTAGDFDGDDRVDLAVANISRRSVSILLNQGDATFGAARDFTVGHSPYAVIAVDYDGNGQLDLITSSEGGDVALLLGNGDGTFQAPLRNRGGQGLRFVVAGDIDGDGDLDLVTNDREGETLTVLYSQVSSTAVDFLEIVCTEADFFKVSAAAGGQGGVERFTKFTLPARDDPSLLQTVFQNTKRYRLHQEFLTQVFPDRFPFLGDAYDALVGRRATRQYFVGAVSRLRMESGTAYGFSVYVNFSDPREVLSLEEVRAIRERLAQAFQLEPLGYLPDSRLAAEAAERWENPGFPVFLEGGGGGDAGGYQAYTLGVGYGRVRILDAAEFEVANRSGLLSFQDIAVLERAPRDIEGVVGGAITAEPQGEGSHLAVRTARRGTPNAFVEGGLGLVAPHEGEVFRREVRESDYTVTPATPEEAEAFWETNRPVVGDLPPLETDCRSFAELIAIGEGDTPGENCYGGKATNFARLQRILTGPFEPYREAGFAVPISYYLDFLRSNTIPSFTDPATNVTYEAYLDELFASGEFQSDSALRFRTLAALRDHMEDEGEVPRGLVTSLAARVGEVFGTTRSKVRARSSSNVEDLLEFNGAGLYESTSACAADDLDLDDSGPSSCDSSRTRERGFARALKRVWASLWNFRAYEERAFFGIQENVGMGLLVSRSFGDTERANGVAFTGNPGSPGDSRYLVVSQVGEVSVVSPSPGILPETVLLEVEGGRVEIRRVRGSSLLPEGSHVLSDEKLRELGLLLQHIDDNFPVDPGDHDPEQILIDIEFKLEPDDSLAVKQARPFLDLTPPLPAPRFELEIPAGTVACGGFGLVSRTEGPRTEYELKSILRFVEGSIALPTANETFRGELVEEIIFGPGRESLMPSSPGEFRVARDGGADDVTTFTFSFEQEFTLPTGEPFQLSLSLLQYRARGAEPLERQRTLDDELVTEELFLQGTFSRGDEVSTVFYSSCTFESLPLWEVRAEFGDATTLRLEERFLPSPLERGTGPASLMRAQVELRGSARETTDYWELVYSAGRHNDHVRYWVVLEPMISVAGLERPVRVVELAAPDPEEGLGPEAAYLDENYVVLGRPEVTLFEKELVQGPPSDVFRRGDVDADGDVILTDAVRLLVFLFQGGEAPPCDKAADANDSGRIDISDAVSVLLFLFRGSGSLPGPCAACGLDPTPDELTCGAFPPCEN